MKSMEYVQSHFLSEEELLRLCQLSAEALREFQVGGVMPQPSYRAEVNASIHSIFGAHEVKTTIAYYPKSAVYWVGLLQNGLTSDEAFALFSRRYRARIQALAEMGLNPSCSELTDGLDEHLQREWQHFLEGTYGLCTKTALPEDIATKEVAIFAIDEWTDRQQKANLSDEECQKVALAVKLLDEASALFAAHERARSSRARCIGGVRAKYNLPATESS